jgi:hypothetical protein
MNQGAETIVQGRNGEFADWERVDGLAAPASLSYAEGKGSPSPPGPGPNDRGSRLFGSGDHVPSGIHQSISVDREWVKAIEEGRVGAHLSAFLGGSIENSDLATVRVAFLNAND